LVCDFDSITFEDLILNQNFFANYDLQISYFWLAQFSTCVKKKHPQDKSTVH